MKTFSKVIVAISNDKFEHIVGLWESVKECARDLKTSKECIHCKISRQNVDKTLDAKLQWMVVEDI